MTGPLPATQRGTVLAGVKAKPFGWPAASLDPGCGRHPANRRRTGLEERPKTKIRQSEVSTLLGDCRTSYGACVLHVAPESFIGGPLAFVHNGDIIELDVAAQKLSLQITDEELDERRADWQQPTPKYARGYGALYLQHITQADQGCDFDFLETGPPTPEPEIH